MLMSHNRFSSFRKWVVACLSIVVWTAAAADTTSRRNGEAAPPWVGQSVTEANLAGEGQLRFLGLRIYDARLWVAPGFQAETFEAHPLALELTYHRAFTGVDIARRSISEIERQVALTRAQAERWQQSLVSVLPDVQPGDRLTGIYQPNDGMQLWRGDQALGALADTELARLFFGIWLSPRSSEPALRNALLGHTLRPEQ